MASCWPSADLRCLRRARGRGSQVRWSFQLRSRRRLVLSGAGYAIGGLLALPLIAAATWWDPSLRLDATRAGIFLLVGILAAALPRLAAQN